MICVLGVHRSGTSLVTRALHLLGVPLGPDAHVMRPRVGNPLGFFEHQPLTDLNDEILWRLGGCWHTPPAFPDGWATSPALDDFRSRARVILKEDFGSTALWGTSERASPFPSGRHSCPRRVASSACATPRSSGKPSRTSSDRDIERDDSRRMETIGGWMRTGLRAMLPGPLYAGLRQAYNRRFVWRR